MSKIRAAFLEALNQKKTIVVIGLGRSGCAAAIFCRRLGLEVIAVDERAQNEFEKIAKDRELLRSLVEGGVECIFAADKNSLEPYLKTAALCIVSPGVPLTAALVRRVIASDIPITNELELAALLSGWPIILVTGSNGKSTTVSLIQHLLQAGNVPSVLCGNIGTPLLSCFEVQSLEELEKQEKQWLVVEASSYQLESSSEFSPQIAVFHNLSENHLERHSTMENYFEAKASVFLRMAADTLTVLNADDARVAALERRVESRILYFGKDAERDCAARIRYDIPKGVDAVQVKDSEGRKTFLTRGIQLIGLHNRYNVAAALLVAREVGISDPVLKKALNSFCTLEHRLELLPLTERIVINDSKATTVAAARAALEAICHAFPNHRMRLMLGGLAKQGGWAPIMDYLHELDCQVVCFGQDAHMLLELCVAHQVPALETSSMEAGVREALSGLSPNDVLLFSPGCASFDEFTDFEERGNVFKSLIKKQLRAA